MSAPTHGCPDVVGLVAGTSDGRPAPVAPRAPRRGLNLAELRTQVDALRQAAAQRRQASRSADLEGSATRAYLRGEAAGLDAAAKVLARRAGLED